jgi:hypothetical protein
MKKLFFKLAILAIIISFVSSSCIVYEHGHRHHYDHYRSY